MCDWRPMVSAKDWSQNKMHQTSIVALGHASLKDLELTGKKSIIDPFHNNRFWVYHYKTTVFIFTRINDKGKIK